MPRLHVYLRQNSLSLAFAGLTILSLVGHLLTGHAADRSDRQDHGVPAIDLLTYASSPAFLSTLFENLESEFLQMALFVILTIWLRQKGSSESKPLGEPPPKKKRDPASAPWPVRRGGLWLRLYEHSLSGAMLALFFLCFAVHSLASHTHHLREAIRHGGQPHGFVVHLSSSQFWFESFQNWQSEFFSIAVLIVFSIYLRERDSAQSKDVEAPHSETGN